MLEMKRLRRLFAIGFALLMVIPIVAMGDTQYRATRDTYAMIAEETTTETTTTTTTAETTRTTTRATTTTTEVTTTTTEETTTTTTEVTYSEPHLNPRDGIVRAEDSPSGYRETFYNLYMFGCLDLLGYSHDGYKERADGIKTYNGYVMVASPDLDAYPKGSLIPTSVGMGIVVDYCPAGNLDIAVNW